MDPLGVKLAAHSARLRVPPQVKITPVTIGAMKCEWVYDKNMLVPEEEGKVDSAEIADPMSSQDRDLYRSRRYSEGGPAEDEVHKCALLYLHGGTCDRPSTNRAQASLDAKDSRTRAAARARTRRLPRRLDALAPAHHDPAREEGRALRPARPLHQLPPRADAQVPEGGGGRRGGASSSSDCATFSHRARPTACSAASDAGPPPGRRPGARLPLRSLLAQPRGGDGRLRRRRPRLRDVHRGERARPAAARVPRGALAVDRPHDHRQVYARQRRDRPALLAGHRPVQPRLLLRLLRRVHAAGERDAEHDPPPAVQEVR